MTTRTYKSSAIFRFQFASAASYTYPGQRCSFVYWMRALLLMLCGVVTWVDSPSRELVQQIV